MVEASFVLKNKKRGKFSVVLELVEKGKVIGSKKFDDIDVNWGFSKRIESVAIAGKNIHFSLVMHTDPSEKKKKEIMDAIKIMSDRKKKKSKK